MEKLDCPACGTPSWQDSVGRGPFECGTCGVPWRWEETGWTVLGNVRSGKSSVDSVEMLMRYWLDAQLSQFNSLFGITPARVYGIQHQKGCSRTQAIVTCETGRHWYCPECGEGTPIPEGYTYRHSFGPGNDLVAEEVHRAVDEYLDEEAESGYLGERYRFEGGSTREEPTTGNKAIGITDEEAAAVVSWSTNTATSESHRVMTALAARLSVPGRGELAPDCICLPEGSAVVGYRMDAERGVITEAFVAGPWGSPVSGRWLPWLGVPDREEPAPCRCGDQSGPVCGLHPDHADSAEDGTDES